MEEENKNEKLSYEQLKAYVEQMQAQAKKIYQENITLKQIINAKDIDYAFKCLDHAELFSKKFINMVINKLEELLTPDNDSQEKDFKEDK